MCGSLQPKNSAEAGVTKVPHKRLATMPNPTVFNDMADTLCAGGTEPPSFAIIVNGRVIGK